MDVDKLVLFSASVSATDTPTGGNRGGPRLLEPAILVNSCVSWLNLKLRFSGSKVDGLARFRS